MSINGKEHTPTAAAAISRLLEDEELRGQMKRGTVELLRAARRHEMSNYAPYTPGPTKPVLKPSEDL